MTRTFVLRSRSKRDPIWTPTEDAKVVRLRDSGLSDSAIAEKFKGSRTPSAVKNRLWRLRQEETT